MTGPYSYTRPLRHEIRRVRELAYEADVAVPDGLEFFSQGQVRLAIARLAPRAAAARRRLRGVVA